MYINKNYIKLLKINSLTSRGVPVNANRPNHG